MVAEAPRGKALRLGLKWKTFAALLLLFGGIQLILSLFQVRAEHEQQRQAAQAQTARLADQFAAVSAEVAGERALVATQLAASLDSRTLPRDLPENAPLPLDTAATLAWLSFFDAEGRPLATWLGRPEAVPDRLRTELQERVRRTRKPQRMLVCVERCVRLHQIPAFDRTGRELIIELAGDMTTTLTRFRYLTGADVVLFGGNRPIARLWERDVALATRATELLELFGQFGAPPPPGVVVGRDVAGRHFNLLEAELAHSWPAGTTALFVLDDTEQVDAIARDARADMALTLAALVLTGFVLFGITHVATRRLDRVIHALPLLAEQRFDDARSTLAAAPPALLRDEVDLLRDTARQLTDRLQQLQGAEARSEATSRFLARMSHELRTPMNGILGLLELHEATELSDGQRESVRVMRDSALTLLTILDDILDLSKIEAGRMDVEQVPFSMLALVEGVLDTLASTARAKSLRLVSFVAPGLPARVLGDPVRLRQILFNLCGNAIKFTPAGHVTVRVETGTRPDQVRFGVRDSGIGIPPEAQARLFQPFTQAEASTRRYFGGTGLGLTISKGLVERMGGTIGFSTVPGQGSEFWFVLELPAAAEDADATRPPAALRGIRAHVALADADEAAIIGAYLASAGAILVAATAPHELRVGEDPAAGALVIEAPASGGTLRRLPRPVGFRRLLAESAETCGRAGSRPAPPRPVPGGAPLGGVVLVAEDHPTNRFVVREQLRRLGCEARFAANGAEALAQLAEGGVDLLLADLHMPGMDGYELAREIRRREAAGERPGRLPIIAQSADVASNVRERCSAAGFDSYLSKPVAIEALRAELERRLPRRSTASRVLDPEVLVRLIGSDDRLQREILQDFLRVNGAALDQLREAVRFSNEDDVRKLAHRLKGSARTIGAPVLAAAAERMEAWAPGGGDLAALHTALLEAYRLARLAILERLEAPAAGLS